MAPTTMVLLLLTLTASRSDKGLSDTADIDVDGDGFGPAEGDCDDADSTIQPEAEDVLGDGVDSNCDGLDFVSDDLDGVELHAPWAESRAGESLAGGDLDDDGYVDLVVGAPYFDDGPSFGSVAVMHGPVTESRNLRDGTAFTGELEDQYSFVGWAVAVPGDMDGDGYQDLAYSVPFGDGEEPLSGLVYIIDGPAEESNDFKAPDRSVAGAVREGNLGAALSEAGDANGDGLADLLVGSPRPGYPADREPDYPGRTFIFSGPIDGALMEEDAWLTLIGAEELDYTGGDVASGDFNGDGHPDVLGASKFATPRGTESGEAWVVYGPMSGTLTLDAAGGALLGEQEGDYAGQAVASAGDVDGDGADDLLVAALRTGVGERDGRVYLLYGPVTGSLGLESADATFPGIGAYDWQGYALGGAGDTDGDGVAEFVVAAPQQYETSSGRFSRLALFEGPQSGEVGPEAAIRTFVSPEYGDAAGWSFVAGDDLTGDGAPDLVTGLPYSDEDGARAGLVRITAL